MSVLRRSRRTVIGVRPSRSFAWICTASWRKSRGKTSAARHGKCCLATPAAGCVFWRILASPIAEDSSQLTFAQRLAISSRQFSSRPPESSRFFSKNLRGRLWTVSFSLTILHVPGCKGARVSLRWLRAPFSFFLTLPSREVLPRPETPSMGSCLLIWVAGRIFTVPGVSDSLGVSSCLVLPTLTPLGAGSCVAYFRSLGPSYG